MFCLFNSYSDSVTPNYLHYINKFDLRHWILASVDPGWPENIQMKSLICLICPHLTCLDLSVYPPTTSE